VKVDTSQAQDIVMVGTDSGLWRSTDGGLTYTQVSSIPSAYGDYVWNLVQTSAGWLASSEVPFVIGGGGGTSTLYFSADHGATWAPISNAGNGYRNAGRTSLGIGNPGDAVVYAYAAAGEPPPISTKATSSGPLTGGRPGHPCISTAKSPRTPMPTNRRWI
jgi:hypothetical protein